jgi:hypothetical protein
LNSAKLNYAWGFRHFGFQWRDRFVYIFLALLKEKQKGCLFFGHWLRYLFNKKKQQNKP